jgi:hypothetical protein
LFLGVLAVAIARGAWIFALVTGGLAVLAVLSAWRAGRRISAQSNDERSRIPQRRDVPEYKVEIELPPGVEALHLGQRLLVLPGDERPLRILPPSRTPRGEIDRG